MSVQELFFIHTANVQETAENRRAEKTAEAAKFDAFGPNHGGGCLCIVRTCLFRLPAVPNAASHCGHAWYLRFSCTVRTYMRPQIARTT
jgi:hypothetical protein